jgi:Domain of Unknown Function (DUF1080)
MSTSTEQAENRPPVHPPAAPKKRISLAAIVCGGLAIIALVGGSLLWLLQGSAKPAGKAVRATPTATATSTPTWAPTQTTPPADAIFYDTFANNYHGWSQIGDNVEYRLLTDNMLILVNKNPNTPLIESVPPNTPFSNYQISVDFSINQGDARDSTGLYLRGDSNLDHDYRVDVNGNGTIDIVKEWLDENLTQQTTTLYAPHRASYLKPLYQQNTLTVIMLDSTIVVEVNGFVLATVYDSSYTDGQIALFARHGKTSSGINVSFTRVEIDRLASPTDMLTPTPTPTISPTAGNP